MPSRTTDPARAAGAAQTDAAAGRVAAAGTADATGERNAAWALALADSLATAGVRDAVIAPGSRSAPLALAIHRSPIRTHVAIDERAGAYFAVGLARAARRPVAVVTTSGTAAANLHPAALEALHGRVPLLLLTADRPPELHDVGAPQTMDQIRLFGTGVSWFADSGTPEPGAAALRHIASLGARAVAAAWGPPAGPVHLNLPFREPLLPDAATFHALAGRQFPGGGAGRAVEEATAPVASAASAAAVRRVAKALRGRRQGVIVCGPLSAGPDFAAAVARLAAVTGYPVLADPLSGLRFGAADRSHLFGAYELFFRSPRFGDLATVDAIVQFGAPILSKAWHFHAARHPGAYRVLIDEAGAPRDPTRLTRDIVRGEPAATANALADTLAGATEPLPAWIESFRRAERAATGAVARHLESAATLGEEGVFPPLLAALAEAGAPGGQSRRRPEGGTEPPCLYVGNSMPIRDLDLAGAVSGTSIRVLGNRGVNGIDGVVSSALGASAAGDAPLAAVVGDLSFHHDLNALAALREGQARATIVVVQNDGGGIFSFLPAASHGDAFERYFGTPHGLDIARVAALYGVKHRRCVTAADLKERAAASLGARETVIVEVRTDRAENRAAHARLAEAARSAVEAAL